MQKRSEGQGIADYRQRMKEDGLTENDRQDGHIHRIADPVIGAGSDQKDGASIGASVPLPTKVKRPLHHKKRTSPARSGSNPMSQREGTSRTASPEDCTSSQGMTPATVPGIKAMKNSDRRTTMQILL